MSAADFIAIDVEGKFRAVSNDIHGERRVRIGDGPSTTHLSWSARLIIVDVRTPRAIRMEKKSIDPSGVSRLVAEIHTKIRA